MSEEAISCVQSARGPLVSSKPQAPSGGETQPTEKESDKFVGIFAPRRAILVDMLQDGDRDMSVPVLTIGMPCGNTYIFECREEMPQKTLNCECGNPEHVVIQYAVEEKDAGTLRE